jgi:SAM-dependent methyltransferase
MSKVSRPDEYPESFYDAHRTGSERSAAAVLDQLRLLGLGPWPRVVDVGCGQGEWLRASLGRGATTAVGIDGPWNESAFDPNGPVAFRSCDLANASSNDLASLVGGERFDLAISVEALEHIPPAAGARVIEALVSWSDLVVFSAAIPGQGGRQHQNEQWQSHWADEFAKYGYEPYDLVRPALWDRAEVEPWYRQNVLVYAATPPRPELRPAARGFLDLVHPEVFSLRRVQLSGSELAHAASGLGRRRLEGLLRRLRS